MTFVKASAKAALEQIQWVIDNPNCREALASVMIAAEHLRDIIDAPEKQCGNCRWCEPAATGYTHRFFCSKLDCPAYGSDVLANWGCKDHTPRPEAESPK